MPASRRSRRIRTLIADDESLARELLTNLVRRDPELELVGAAASGAEALAGVQAFSPDLLLLDIQMPSLDGISVAEQLSGSEKCPYIVFVTAHDTFAIQAFEVAARDYLVKPLSKRRFATAMQRAKSEILGDDISTNELGESPFTVRSGETLVSLLPSDVVWVEAANQYVRIHTVASRVFVVSQSLRQFAQRLPSRSFSRIHRSTLINKQHIAAVLSSEGRYRAQLSDGSVHDIARNRKSMVKDLLRYTRSQKSL